MHAHRIRRDAAAHRVVRHTVRSSAIDSTATASAQGGTAAASGSGVAWDFGAGGWPTNALALAEVPHYGRVRNVDRNGAAIALPLRSSTPSTRSSYPVSGRSGTG